MTRLVVKEIRLKRKQKYTDDEGKVMGFTKSWKDKNSSFTYSFHSTDEDDVLELMKKFQIS